MDLDLIRQPLKEKLEKLGYELHSLSFKKAKDNVLSLIVDKDENISMDDIVKVSEEVSALLDTLMVENEPYMLEVASLGIEKEIPISKIDKYINKYMEVRTKHPIKGENIFLGDLLEVNDNNIKLKTKNKNRYINIEISKENINKIRLQVKF